MKRPRRVRPASTGLSPREEARVEALTVAMALAPGVYARNRMFALFAHPAVQRARSRAALLRGIVKHLGRACAVTVTRQEVDFVLRYQIPALRLTRIAELSRIELATLRMMAARANASCLLLENEDRALVNETLTRLLVAGGDAAPLARAAQDIATLPGE